MLPKTKEYGLAERKSKKSNKFLWLYLLFAGVLLLVAMSFATQRIAAFFDYHSALGAPLGVALGRMWYWPWAVLFWDLPAHKAIEDSIF